MALNWFLNSASTLVSGLSTADGKNNLSPNGKQIQIQVNGQNVRAGKQMEEREECPAAGFQMPLHYPRYKRADYEKMEEWKLDLLLRQYGLNFKGTLEEKRRFAIGAFLWPDQLY